MASDIIERWKASALSTALIIYPCQILVHQRWQSKLQLPTARKKEWRPATAGSSPHAVTVYTVIHTTLVGLEPATFRSFVRRATSSTTEPLFNPLSPFHWPRNMTSADSEWLECSLYVTVLRFAILPSVISSYLITVEYVNAAAWHHWHVTRIEVREVEFRIVIRQIFTIGETLHCRTRNELTFIAKIMIRASLRFHWLQTLSRHALNSVLRQYVWSSEAWTCLLLNL